VGKVKIRSVGAGHFGENRGEKGGNGGLGGLLKKSQARLLKKEKKKKFSKQKNGKCRRKQRKTKRAMSLACGEKGDFSRSNLNSRRGKE